MFPLIDIFNLDLKKKRENNLQLCTRNMMQLLVEEYKAQTLMLEKDIDCIYSKLQSFKSLSTFKEQEDKITIYLDQVTVDILGKKENMFW